MKMNKTQFLKNPSAQQGAVLIIVLILLLIMTLLGLASMRGALMQERMAGATYARSAAFNAAEAALRIAEGNIVANMTPPAPGSGCSSTGFCAKPDPAATPIWADSSWNSRSVDAGLGAGYTNVNARYVIEYMGEIPDDSCGTQLGTPTPCAQGIRLYRITAKAITDNGSEVILQSNYRTL